MVVAVAIIVSIMFTGAFYEKRCREPSDLESPTRKRFLSNIYLLFQMSGSVKHITQLQSLYTYRCLCARPQDDYSANWLSTLGFWPGWKLGRDIC